MAGDKPEAGAASKLREMVILRVACLAVFERWPLSDGLMPGRGGTSTTTLMHGARVKSGLPSPSWP